MKIAAEDGRGKPIGRLEIDNVTFIDSTPEFEYLTLTWKSKKGTKTWTHGLRVRVLTRDGEKVAVIKWKERERLERAKLLERMRDG